MKISTKKAQLQKQIEQLKKELRSIENSAAFRKENAIKRSLTTLMKKHGCSSADLITLLQDDSSAPAKRGKRSAASGTRKPRKLKIFRNPNSGETVETRGGNHKVLKAWKAEHNLATIDEWLVGTKD